MESDLTMTSITSVPGNMCVPCINKPRYLSGTGRLTDGQTDDKEVIPVSVHSCKQCQLHVILRSVFVFEKIDTSTNILLSCYKFEDMNGVPMEALPLPWLHQIVFLSLYEPGPSLSCICQSSPEGVQRKQYVVMNFCRYQWLSPV